MFAAYLNLIPTLNRRNVDLTLAGMSDFLGFGLVSSLKEKVVSLLEQCNCEINNPNEIFDIKKMFDVLEKPFEYVSSEYQRIKSLSDAGVFIKPESYVLDYNNQFVRDDLDMDIEANASCAHVVPLHRSLKVFLGIPLMYECMVDHVNSLDYESNVVKDFLQAELWQETFRKHPGKTVYPLFLHFDGYEPNNALGSHASEDVLNALYCSIASLPSHLRSSVLNMFLVSLFNANAGKSAGNLTTFQSVLEDLKQLAEEGITLDLPSGQVHIYFVLCLIVADNKGNNAVQGFVESFRAFFYCRICKVHRDTAAQLFSDRPELRRNQGNYEVDVAVHDFAQTGIKERCIFNSVPGYHVVDNISCDILHDINQGMLRYGLSAILNELIYNRDYFDLQLFHERVDGFNYGPSELGNKPPVNHLTMDRIRGNSIKLSGSEALCLARYLGEIIGDLVPPENLAWRYYLVMREIVENVTAPYFVKGSEEYLKVIIREHHELYVQIAGHLRPKHHIMTHFPEIMKRNGPFINYSAVSLERKHRQGSMYTRVSNSRRNLSLSVAVKIQLEFAHHVMTFNPRDIFKPLLTVKKVRVSLLPNFNLFLGIMPFPPDHLLSVTRAVDVLGTSYSNNMIVVLESHELYPVLGKIVHILICDDGPMFLVRKLRTVEYRGHFCTYIIRDENQFLFLSQNLFVSYVPLWQRTTEDGQQSVSLKCVL